MGSREEQEKTNPIPFDAAVFDEETSRDYMKWKRKKAMELVPADVIEKIVGATRRPMQHLGRADSKTQIFYILHSKECKDSGLDLRDCCVYSLQLSKYGIDRDSWSGWEDKPVILWINGNGLFPLREV